MFIPEKLNTSKKKMTFRDTNQIIKGFQFINSKDNRAVIDCRVYASKYPYGSRVTAAVWVNDPKGKRHSHGVGIATGYGYHKPSEAIAKAIREMGILLDEAIGGRGYEPCVKAFQLIMFAFGYSSFVTAEFHG